MVPRAPTKSPITCHVMSVIKSCHGSSISTQVDGRVKIMSEGITADELPFFMNPARLRRAETYFAIGRSASEVRNFLEQRRSNSATGEGSKPQGELGHYGVQQFIKLDDDSHEIEEADSKEDVGDADEDCTEYESTSTYSLFWMSMRKLAVLLGCFSKRNTLLENPRSNIDTDLESQTSSHQSEIPDIIFASNSHQTRRIHSDANLNYELDPRVRQDGVIIYRDRSYLIQKLRLDTGWGSFDVLMFSVALPKTLESHQECKTDLQSFVISRGCGSFLWDEDGKATAIFMAGCSDVFIGNVMDWFRKVLSDMALADSVMIGHPYYWHPTVRKRLQRVMKYLKRLYRNLAVREKQRSKPRLATGTRISTNVVEVICPTDISKIVINEQPSRNLMHTCSADLQLHTMLEQLVHKWCDYQSSLKLSPSETAEEISNVYNITHPSRFQETREFLESVTFLDFYPHERIKHIPKSIASPSPQCEAITRTKVQRKNSFIQEILNEQGQLTKAGVLPEIHSHQPSPRRGVVTSEILDQSKWKSSLEDTRMSRVDNLSEVIVTHEKESSKHHPKHLHKKHGPLT